MSDIRVCPACAREMEYDSLTGRFVCTECGRSERAEKDSSPAASVPQAPVPAAPASAPSVKSTSLKPTAIKPTTIKSTSIKPVSDKKTKPASDNPAQESPVVPASPFKPTAPVVPEKTVPASTVKPAAPVTQKKKPYTEALEKPSSRDDQKKSSDRPVVSEKRKEDSSDTKPVSAKTDPYVILHAYAQDFECDTVEEVLVQSEKIQSEEYLDMISTHPSLATLREVLPKTKIPQNITEYCNKVRQIDKAEKDLRGSQEDLKRTEKYVKASIEREKYRPKRKEKADKGTIGVYLSIPLIMFFVILFGRWKTSHEKFVQNKSDFKTLVIMFILIYAVIFIIMGVYKIRSLLEDHKYSPGAKNKVIEIRKDAIDDGFERIYKFQEEKGEILKNIRDEENALREKYIKRAKR
ncbi:MAG: hypothetical protein IKR22_00925 [Clostridiales bacterium]|nr:hypothetical protein [Clostridiales bacterium]